MAWNIIGKIGSLCLMMLFLATGALAQDVEEQFRIDVAEAFTAASQAQTDAGKIARLEAIAALAAEGSGTTNGELWALVASNEDVLLEAGQCVPSPTAVPPITCP